MHVAQVSRQPSWALIPSSEVTLHAVELPSASNFAILLHLLYVLLPSWSTLNTYFQRESSSHTVGANDGDSERNGDGAAEGVSEGETDGTSDGDGDGAAEGSGCVNVVNVELAVRL